MSDKKILGVITARGGSKGVPGKNIKLLCGKPLIQYTIDCAAEVSFLFHRILVSTDDHDIADVARKCGADVPFIRPHHLALDATPTLPVILHAVEFVEQRDSAAIDWVMILQPTSPLRQAKDIAACVELADEDDCDTVVSVFNANSHHPLKMKQFDERGFLKSYLTDLPEPTRRQELQPTVYQRNGAIYLVRKSVLQSGSLYGSRVKPYLMPEERSLDIDTLYQFRLAESLVGSGLC